MDVVVAIAGIMRPAICLLYIQHNTVIIIIIIVTTESTQRVQTFAKNIILFRSVN